MKNLFLTAVFLLSALCVNAQKELAVDKQYPGDEGAQRAYQTAVEKQSNEKTTAVRTTWVANRPGANWFISVQGGMGGLVSETPLQLNLNPIDWFNKDKRPVTFWHPMVGASLGKWFSPVWGLRLNATASLRELAGWIPKSEVGSAYWLVDRNDKAVYLRGSTIYLGQQVAGQRGDFKDKPGYAYGVRYIAGTLDYMVNLKNLFGGYNPKAFFNPVIYAGVGYAHTLGDKDKGKAAVHSMAGKAGMQWNFRLNRAFDLFLDGHALVLPENFDRRINGGKTIDFVANGSLGLTYRMNFRSFIAAPLYDPSEIDALNREINDLRNQLRNRPQEKPCPPPPPCPECPVVPSTPGTSPTQPYPQIPGYELTPVFFDINSFVVRDNQLVNVAKAAEYLVSHPGSKLELASYADKRTGTPAYNLSLSKKRSEAVAKMLVSKFGIDRKRLIVKYYGDKVQPFAENDLNRVTLFVHP
jgi:outer membrane protein OmpA-like peptidoglycan-associated protein